MAWTILLISAVLEAVWATALALSAGFTKVWPIVIFILGIIGSMWGLTYAVKQIPISVAYAVWVGIGGALTVLVAMSLGYEEVKWSKIVCITVIIACTIGLKLNSHPSASKSSVSESA